MAVTLSGAAGAVRQNGENYLGLNQFACDLLWGGGVRCLQAIYTVLSGESSTEAQVGDGFLPRVRGAALIVDDICDGGRTFIELAKVLREAGATRVFLYVTHGIFPQGLGVFAGLIDGVFTTDAFLSDHVGSTTPLPSTSQHFASERTRP